MVTDNSKKVFIVNNVKSDNIEQVIFILKSKQNYKEFKKQHNDIVNEAQTIINNYAYMIDCIKDDFEDPFSNKRKFLKRIFLSGFLLSSAGILLAFLLKIFSY